MNTAHSAVTTKMDVIDSPLNLAHQQGRRADSLLKALKYEEAITCHKKAADLMLLTMRNTHNLEALQSLTLQREFHLKQEGLIRQKQQLAINSKKKTKKQRPLSGQDQAESDYRGVKYKLGADMNIQNNPGSSDNYSEAPIIKIINDCDSLVMGILGPSENSENKVETRPKSAEMDTGVKIKNVVVIEELLGHLHSVKSQAINMIKDAELLQRQVQHFKSENEQLKEKLNRTERAYMEDSTESEKYYPVPVGMNLHDLPSLELPPLEMPKFDFSALKMEAEDALD